MKEEMARLNTLIEKVDTLFMDAEVARQSWPRSCRGSTTPCYGCRGMNNGKKEAKSLATSRRELKS